MPDPVVTPPAAPAAPGATPPATPPVAATPPIPETPAAPAAPESILPPIDQVTAEIEPPAAPTTTVNQDEPEWFLSEGVRGTGKAPDWYLADKYKNMAEQAKAYPELAKKLGAFTGAPKEGYKVELPKEFDGSLDLDHPFIAKLKTWAADRQMNQEAFTEALTMVAAYESELAPDPAAIMAQIGDDAEKRVRNVASWAKANLDAAQYDSFRAATAGVNAAEAFKTFEVLIAKSRQPKTPKPGADVPGGQPTGEAAIRAAQDKRGPDGKRLVETDPQYRASVDRMWQDFYASQTKAA